MKARVWAVMLIVVLSACKSIENQDKDGIQEDTLRPGGILFLTIGVKKEDERLIFELESAKSTSGNLKNRQPHIPAGSEQWLLEFLDEGNNVIKKLPVENPLTRSVEVSNEEGRFERRQLSLDKASFVVRLDYLRSMAQIRISTLSGEVLSRLNLDSDL